VEEEPSLACEWPLQGEGGRPKKKKKKNFARRNEEAESSTKLALEKRGKSLPEAFSFDVREKES